MLSNRLKVPHASDTQTRASSPAAVQDLPSRGNPADEIDNWLGNRLVRVPAGRFWMGNLEPIESLAQAFGQYESERFEPLADELPCHGVRITRDFYLGRHPVTVGQFRQFVERSGYVPESERDGTGAWGYRADLADFEGRKPEYSWQNPGFEQDDRHPVVNVTWNDGLALCDWLSRIEGRTYHLPSEAQWEYACRAGTETRYWSGDDPESLAGVANIFDAESRDRFPRWSRYAVAASDGHPFTAPVASYPANAFGLFDMHGNVWEWCADWYSADYYRYSPIDDPRGPTTGTLRVRRGGSWHSWPLYLRSSYRNWNLPDSRYVLVGIRLAAEAE